ncbi:MAG TPA: flagellar biosynthetic protein FliO [Alphaproteobacteria bacterium]|jgi:flagellar protein FliO/FliZ|nr:flagellar biosynthetic protein FliO [Alphaproteobacteria bacterium]
MDYDIFLRFLVALIFVLGLIGLLAWAARRFGIGGRVAVRPGRRRRMAIVEATAVDAKRRLVLVRRDDVEHLILLGPTVDLVVEQGIAVPVDQLEVPRAGGASGDGQPRDFASELKARLGFGGATEAASALPAPTQAPAPPKTPLASAKRRLSKTKLAQLKPERLRFGKQPGTKR